MPRDDGARAAPRATAAGTLDPTALGRDSRNCGIGFAHGYCNAACARGHGPTSLTRVMRL